MNDSNLLTIVIGILLLIVGAQEELPTKHNWVVKPTQEIKSCLSPDLEDEERENCRFFAAVIDAGSTGTRLHLLEFSHDPSHIHSPFKVEKEVFREVKPGLSSFANEPLKAAESVRELVNAARNTVPKELWQHTPIVMKATAGLRLLPDDQADTILLEVEKELKQSGLLLDDDSVGILSGTDEGVFGWFTLNYLMGKLKYLTTNVQKTAVALDLGGGSTQITFSPKNFEKTFNERVSKQEFGHILRVFGNKIKLYTHSYLGNGLVAARLGIGQMLRAEDNELEMATHCFPKGYVLNDWDYAGNGWKVVSTSDASYKNCIQSTQEYVKKTNVRKVTEISDREIYVFAYFYDRAEQAGLVNNGQMTVGDYAKEAEKVCAIPASELGPEHWRPWQCLDLCYIYTLLHDGYGLRDDQILYPTKKLQNMEVSWALGSSYHLLNTYHEKQIVSEYSCDTTEKFKNKTTTNSTIVQIYEYLSEKTTQLLTVLRIIS